MLILENDTGYINFPNQKNIDKIDGSTLVYLIIFDVTPTPIANINLFKPGMFISDDVLSRTYIKNINTLEDVISHNTQNDWYEKIYFPNTKLNDWKKMMSFDLISCICIGWSNYTYEYNDQVKFWHANFNNLTTEGKKLYYLIKKLHNNKECRIMTFNEI